MVAMTELSRANALMGEKEILVKALANLNEGGTIINMTIGPDPVTIATEDMEPPPPMMETLKTIITARRDAVEQQLQELGVTTGV